MSQADWTPSPVTEREAAILRRRTRWQPLNVVFAALSCCGALASVALALSATVDVGTRLLFVVASAILGVLPLWFATRDNALLKESHAPDRAKRDEFGSGLGWLVDLTILQGDAPTGSDRGMLWIEDGRLCFAGDRTSFALAPGQIAGRWHKEGRIGGLRRGNRLPLGHVTGAGQLALSFDLVVDDPEERKLAQVAVSEWTGTRPDIEGQLPPTRLGPGAPSRGRILLGAASRTAYWIGALALGGAVVAYETESGLLILGLLALWGWMIGGFTVALRWRAWRDLGRVAPKGEE